MARKYARTNAEAARLGIPTWNQAKRSKEAAAERGVSQAVLRGHARRAKGEIGIREIGRALRELFPPATVNRPGFDGGSDGWICRSGSWPSGPSIVARRAAGVSRR